MTEEDQNAALGRMIMRFSEAKKRRIALMSEAEGIGKRLTSIGRGLESVNSVKEFFDGDTRRGEDSTKDALAPVQAYPTADQINSLLTELRTVSGEVRQFRANLKQAGLDVE
jgi:hypothetical protein